MRHKPANLIGGFYADENRLWSAQDVCNWLPTVTEVQGTRTPVKLETPPGLSYFTQCGDGPIRGARDVEGKLFVVSGTELYEVALDGTPTLRGTIPGSGRVSMSHNKRGYGNELLIVNGSAGYVWDTTGTTLTKITDSGYPGSVMVDYLDHYLIQVEPWGRYWFHSNLDSATDYNTLDQYDAEAAPDKIKGIAAYQLEAVVFSGKTTEFFADTGAATGTFQNKRIVLERGCAGRHTIVKFDNSLMWLGNDGIFYRLNGYGAQPISPRPIAQAIAGLNWENAFGFAWEDRGRKAAYWTFPDGQTWGYDPTQPVGFQWHRRESYGLDRWRLNTCTAWQGMWIGGDYRTGILYKVEFQDSPHEMGRPLVSECVTPPISDNQNAVICPYLELIFDTGRGNGVIPDDEIPPGPSLAGAVGDGFVGEAVDYTYTLSGGEPPLGPLSVTSGAVIPGTTLSSDGVLTGTRTTVGTASWNMEFEDARGDVATSSDSSETTDPDTWFINAGPANESWVGKWTGDSWTAKAAPTLTGYAFYSGSYLYIAGLTSASGLYSANKGTAYTAHNVPAASSGAGRMAAGNGFLFRCCGVQVLARCVAPTGAWATPSANTASRADDIVIQNSKVLLSYSGRLTLSISSDWGGTWTSGGAFNTNSNNGFTRLCAVNGTLYLLYNDGSVNGYNLRIKRSTDDGATWSAVLYTFANPALANTACELVFDGTNIVAVSATGQIAYADADGDTWTLSASTFGAACNQIAVGTRKMLAACNSGLLYSSVDNGVTWQQRTDPSSTKTIAGVAWVHP